MKVKITFEYQEEDDYGSHRMLREYEDEPSELLEIAEEREIIVEEIHPAENKIEPVSREQEIEPEEIQNKKNIAEDKKEENLKEYDDDEYEYDDEYVEEYDEDEDIFAYDEKSGLTIDEHEEVIEQIKKIVSQEETEYDEEEEEFNIPEKKGLFVFDLRHFKNRNDGRQTRLFYLIDVDDVQFGLKLSTFCFSRRPAITPFRYTHEHENEHGADGAEL